MTSHLKLEIGNVGIFTLRSLANAFSEPMKQFFWDLNQGKVGPFSYWTRTQENAAWHFEERLHGEKGAYTAKGKKARDNQPVPDAVI